MTTTTSRMAPVLVSVYDRCQHLEKCIEALKNNPEAKDTPLYIVSDGWQHEGHRNAIEDVRKYIGTITGFKEVNTRFREKNWGMKTSAMDAITWVLEEHDRLIRMEDDIVCSPHYLE
ncbi:MAG: glycosyltransferase, partial [Pontiella sp.]